MTDVPVERARLSAHDRARLRVTWQITIAGGVLGVVGAVVMGLFGFDGRVGFITVLLGVCLGCVAAALTTTVLAIRDEFRREPVATRRIVVALGLFLVGALLLTSIAAVAGVNP